MKKILPLFCILLIFMSAGCGSKEPAAVKIGPVEISAGEFEKAFQNSRYVYSGENGRALFLDHFIDVKLILLEAERAGLDKESGFLQDIQRFWEQALLKRVLEQKSKELSHTIDISQQEIEAYYQKHKDGDFQGKALEDVEEQIKWMLIRIKQSKALSGWTQGLREKTDIRVNTALLGIEQQEGL